MYQYEQNEIEKVQAERPVGFSGTNKLVSIALLYEEPGWKEGRLRTLKQNLLCFRHLSESRFLLDDLHRRSKFAIFCHDLVQNHLSQLPMYKKVYSTYWFLKNQLFSLFPIEKMKPNHAEICKVGYLESNFQQVLLVQFF